jgi:DNA-binding Lrp family transcriptional regulator
MTKNARFCPTFAEKPGQSVQTRQTPARPPKPRAAIAAFWGAFLKARGSEPNRGAPRRFVRIPTPNCEKKQFLVAKTRLLCLILALSPRPEFSPETMKELDEQERLIVRQLIRDPRESDNGIGEATGVNVRTVGRKRQRLEQAGVLSYYTNLDLSAAGTGQFSTRHLYIIKFRLGVSYRQLLEDIQREPSVRTVFTEVIFESHIAEIDGKLAMLLFIDGANETDIVQTVQEKVIPSLRKNHGENSIEEVSTIRVLAPVRLMRNYVLPVNMQDGYIRKDWPDEAIYVGR